MGLQSHSVIAHFVRQNIVSVVLTLLALIAVKYFLEWLRRYLLLRNVPGPGDTFPPQFVIERLLERPKLRSVGVTILATKLIRDVIDTYADEDDGICKVYAGFTPVVLFTRASSVGTLLSDTVNLDRPMAYKFLEAYIPNSILTLTGEPHKLMRRLAGPTFHFNVLESHLETMNKHSAAFVTYLGDASKKGEIRLFNVMSKYTINVIGEVALGHDVRAFSTENVYGESLAMIQRLVMVRSLLPWFWIDAFYYRFTRHGALFQKYVNTMRSLSTPIMDGLINEELERRGRSEQTKLDSETLPTTLEREKALERTQPVLDAHFENPEVITREMLQSATDGVLFAGQDTTAATLSWLVFLLGLHLDIQEQCRREMFELLGPDPASFVTPEQIKTMKYLDACSKEAMRLYAPVPLVGRQLSTDLVIRGRNKTYTIPAGVQVFASLFHLHRDPKYFPEPHKFDPRRFLDDKAPHNANPYAYAPFSAGRRNCIGQKFAANEVKIILAHLLRNFKWTSTQSRDELELAFEIVLRAKGDLRAKFEVIR